MRNIDSHLEVLQVGRPFCHEAREWIALSIPLVGASRRYAMIREERGEGEAVARPSKKREMRARVTWRKREKELAKKLEPYS